MKFEQKIDQANISADYFPDSEVIPMLNILSELSLILQQVSTGISSLERHKIFVITLLSIITHQKEAVKTINFPKYKNQILSRKWSCKNSSSISPKCHLQRACINLAVVLHLSHNHRGVSSAVY
jgi:hypothetical protein